MTRNAEIIIIKEVNGRKQKPDKNLFLHRVSTTRLRHHELLLVVGALTVLYKEILTMDREIDEQIEAALAQLFMQTHAQFGDAIKGYWFNDSEICPGCGRKVDLMKYKGEAAMSLNAFIYRKPGILIGYFLCGRCAKQIFRDAKKNPGQQTERHDQIEANLIKAYQQHISSMNS